MTEDGAVVEQLQIPDSAVGVEQLNMVRQATGMFDLRGAPSCFVTISELSSSIISAKPHPGRSAVQAADDPRRCLRHSTSILMAAGIVVSTGSPGDLAGSVIPSFFSRRCRMRSLRSA